MARTKRTMTQPTDKSASICNAIINSINEIRKIKRKVPGKESISTLAAKRCGLSVTDVQTELDSMVESGQLQIEKTATNKDSYFVKNLEKVASTSHDESIICSSENEEELLENATINQSSIIDQNSDDDDLSNDLSDPINQSNYGHLDVSAGFPSECLEISDSNLQESDIFNALKMLDNPTFQKVEPKISETTTPIVSSNQGSQLGNDIYLAYSQLASSFADLSKQLHEERIKNSLLNDENFALKLQLCTSGIISKNDNAIVSDDQDNAPNKSSFQKTENPNNCNQKTHTNQNKGVSIVTESIELEQNENINSNSKTNKSGKKKNKRKRTVKRNEPAERSNDTPLNSQPDKQRKAGTWNKNTVLVVGDSMINNVDERQLGKRYQTKVRSFSGATTTDLEDYLKPLLRKKPDKIILVVGTNDIQHRPVADILKNIKRLMEQISESLPDCHVVISEIIKRKMKNGDENQAIAKKINEFNKSLKSMNVDILQQQNILVEHLGMRGLHLNVQGNFQLTKNLNEKIRCI